LCTFQLRNAQFLSINRINAETFVNVRLRIRNIKNNKNETPRSRVSVRPRRVFGEVHSLTSSSFVIRAAYNVSNVGYRFDGWITGANY